MTGLFEPTLDESRRPVSGFPGYDNHNNTRYHQLDVSGAQYDGAAFWYRADPQELLFDPDSGMYGHDSGTMSSATGATSIKHKRTRTGCLTCRNRRVKCDEARPTCDRCRKGGRECEFPQPTTSKRAKSDVKSPTTSKKHERQDSTSTGQKLETIKDEDEDAMAVPTRTAQRPTLNRVRTASTQSLSKARRGRQGSDPSPTLLAFKDRSSPQSASDSSSRSQSETPVSSIAPTMPTAEQTARQAKLKSLKPDVQRHLQFQQEELTHYHYFFKLDPTDWIHTELLDVAFSYEPLLQAVVGFAAYHHEVRKPKAKISHFLGYHSKALSMLRTSLEGGVQYTPAMLLTVLQLATFEECLGDWVNLVGHHRAANSMMNAIYTPETIMATMTGRMIFTWLARMDVIASLMGGKVATIDRAWYQASCKYYEEQIDADPENDLDVDGHFSAFVASNRLIGYDMAKLYSRVPNGDISTEDFHRENAEIIDRLQKFKDDIQALNDGYYTVQEFPAAKDRPVTEKDIVNPYIPGGLFRDALWPMNFMWIDWYAIEMMQKYQASLVLKKPPPPEMELLSLEQCRIYEAVSRWPDAPAGAILGVHASIALAAVFLKKDEKHTMWIRHKLANVERLGYVFPPHYRMQMARLWGLTTEAVGPDNSVEDWWLAHGEGKLPILTEIRRVVGERNQHGEDSMLLKKDVEDVRDLRAIFARLDLRSSTGVADEARHGSVNSLDGFSPEVKSERSFGNESNNSPGTVIYSPHSTISASGVVRINTNNGVVDPEGVNGIPDDETKDRDSNRMSVAW